MRAVAITHHDAFRHYRLRNEYEVGEDCIVAKEYIYAQYESECRRLNLKPKDPNTFGKIVTRVFPHVFTRRLGPIHNQVTHYSGIGPKELLKQKISEAAIRPMRIRRKPRSRDNQLTQQPAAPAEVLQAGTVPTPSFFPSGCTEGLSPPLHQAQHQRLPHPQLSLPHNNRPLFHTQHVVQRRQQWAIFPCSTQPCYKRKHDQISSGPSCCAILETTTMSTMSSFWPACIRAPPAEASEPNSVPFRPQHNVPVKMQEDALIQQEEPAYPINSAPTSKPFFASNNYHCLQNKDGYLQTAKKPRTECEERKT